MPWEMIENVRPTAAKAALPANGVALRCRAIAFEKKRPAKWIELRIGPGLAEQLMLRPGTDHRLALFFGSGDRAGKLAVAIDATNGGFMAKQKKDGSWTASVNEQSCEGLFALDFAPIVLVAEVRHETGQPPKAIIDLPDAMLADDRPR